MSVRYWQGGAPTEAAIEAFTEGDCWILALHLGRITGWPVYTINGNRHWVVRVPGFDRYLDITGVSTRYSLLKEWEGESLTRVDSYLLDYALDDVELQAIETFENSHARAPVMAQRLLEKYGVAA